MLPLDLLLRTYTTIHFHDATPHVLIINLTSAFEGMQISFTNWSKYRNLLWEFWKWEDKHFFFFMKCECKNYLYIYNIKFIKKILNFKKKTNNNNFETSFLFYLFLKIIFINLTKHVFFFLEQKLFFKIQFPNTIVFKKEHQKIILKNYFQNCFKKHFPDRPLDIVKI